MEERGKLLEERLAAKEEERKRKEEEEDRRRAEELKEYSGLNDSEEDEGEGEEQGKKEPETSETPEQSTGYYESNDSEPELPLSSEERRLLEEENARLFSDLNTVKDSVQQLETKVVKIAELQSVFTEKVLSQKEDIELVNANAVASTENVRDANEELRKAIRNQASVRVYVLFFLLVMSFSLLFLDWYNE